MAKYNAEKLLQSYLNKLDITDADDRTLRKVRKSVRSAIKEEFAVIRHAIKTEKTHSHLIGIPGNFLQLLSSAIPKFMTQGSYVYGTLNNPAQIPPQQIDLDDGVYLPMNIVELQPVLAKQIFFKIVDSALKKLALENNWKFVEKKTCARLIVSQKTHMDIPLYAIPNDRFVQLQEARANSFSLQKFMLDGLDDTNTWLDKSEVYLALRGNKEHWKNSDPMEILRWFKNEIGYFGQRLRRVCRYLKGWRDYTWKNGGPSSIALMVCVSNAFRDAATEGKQFKTDCEALLAVAKSLPNQLTNGVRINKEGELFFPKDSPQKEKIEIMQAAKIFESSLNLALNHSITASEVVQGFKKVFGGRIPNDTGLISMGTASVAKQVRATPAKQQYKDTIPKSLRSG